MMFDLSLPLEGKETCCTCGCIPLLLELLTDQDSDTLAQAIASLMRYHFPTLTSLPTSPHLLPSHHFPALTLTSLPHPHPHITSPPSHHFPTLTLTSLPRPHPHITSPPSPSHHFPTLTLTPLSALQSSPRQSTPWWNKGPSPCLLHSFSTHHPK